MGKFFYRVVLRTALVPLLLMGCSSGDGEAPALANRADSKPTDSAHKLTRDYLVGTWCLVNVGMLGSGTNPNINYVFADDGSLQYKADPGMPDQLNGTWEIAGDKLSLNARPLSGPLNVRDISADKFVLDFTVLYTFARGPCRQSN